MAEKPILFSAPMVRAILDGTKTQTRRVVKPQPQMVTDNRATTWEGDAAALLALLNQAGRRCPYGQPGDRLRVKEAAWMWCERRPNGTTKTGRQKWLYVPMREAPVHYAADHPSKPAISVVSPDTGNLWGWRLKIGRFLPAWASRITLEVTGVRVERLQDISEVDAQAEGLSIHPGIDEGGHYYGFHWGPERADESLYPNAKGAYRSLWLEINGPGSWAANPWVWVVEFRRVQP